MKPNTNTLRYFVVRDQDGSYDNEYNEQLVATERQQAITEAARSAVSHTMAYTFAIARRTAYMALNAADQYLDSAR